MATSTTTTTRKPTIKRGSKSYTYHVESKTHAGAFYVADVHHLSCTCPAGRYQRGCWHLRLALGYHDWRMRQQAAAARQTARATEIAALQEAAA